MEKIEGWYVILKNGEKAYYKRLGNASKRYHKEYDETFKPTTLCPWSERITHYMAHIISKSLEDLKNDIAEHILKIFQDLKQE